MAEDIPFLTIHEAGFDGFCATVDTAPVVTVGQAGHKDELWEFVRTSVGTWVIAVVCMFTPGGPVLGGMMVLAWLVWVAVGISRGNSPLLPGNRRAPRIAGPSFEPEVRAGIEKGNLYFVDGGGRRDVTLSDVRLVIQSPDEDQAFIVLEVVRHSGGRMSLRMPVDRKAAMDWLRDQILAATDGLRDELEGEAPEELEKLRKGGLERERS